MGGHACVHQISSVRITLNNVRPVQHPPQPVITMLRVAQVVLANVERRTKECAYMTPGMKDRFALRLRKIPNAPPVHPAHPHVNVSGTMVNSASEAYRERLT